MPYSASVGQMSLRVMISPWRRRRARVGSAHQVISTLRTAHFVSSGKFLFLVVSYLKRDVKLIATLYHVCITSDILTPQDWKEGGQGEMGNLAHTPWM